MPDQDKAQQIPLIDADGNLITKYTPPTSIPITGDVTYDPTAASKNLQTLQEQAAARPDLETPEAKNARIALEQQQRASRKIPANPPPQPGTLSQIGQKLTEPLLPIIVAPEGYTPEEIANLQRIHNGLVVSQEYAKQHPFAIRLGQGLSALSSPAMSASMWGLELLGLTGTAGKIISGLVGQGFTAEQLIDAYHKFPQFKDALDRGDTQKAWELAADLTTDVGFGALGAYHIGRQGAGVLRELPSLVEPKISPEQAVPETAAPKAQVLDPIVLHQNLMALEGTEIPLHAELISLGAVDATPIRAIGDLVKTEGLAAEPSAVSAQAPALKSAADLAKDAGVEYRGLMKLMPDRPGAEMFQDPVSGTSFSVKEGQVTPEEFRKALDAARQRIADNPPSQIVADRLRAAGYKIGGERFAEPQKITINDLHKEKGLPPVNLEKVPVDKKEAAEIADAYDQMQHNPDAPEVKAAYDALKAETVEQFKHIRDKYGIKLELTDKADYYPTVQAMFDDIRNNHVLKVWSGEGEVAGPNHPLMEKVDIPGVPEGTTYNTLFRWVHDILGHEVGNNDFTELGEENAYNLHKQSYSKAALPALTTETKGQASWFFNNKKVRESGELGGFPTQKAGLLPEKFYREEPVQKTEEIQMAAPESKIPSKQETAPKEIKGSLGTEIAPLTPLKGPSEEIATPPTKEQDYGISPAETRVHEIAHILAGDEVGFPQPKGKEGVRSHLHPSLQGTSAAASVILDFGSAFRSPETLAKRIGDVVATLVAGGVSQQQEYGRPLHENRGMRGDLARAVQWMKQAGLSSIDQSLQLAKSIQQAEKILSHPAARAIMKKYSETRVPGTDEAYHISPENAIQMVKEYRNAKSNMGAKASESGEGGRTDAGGDKDKITLSAEGPTISGRSDKANVSRGEGGLQKSRTSTTLSLGDEEGAERKDIAARSNQPPAERPEELPGEREAIQNEEGDTSFTPEDSPTLSDRLKEKFGTTNDPLDAGFILANGDMIPLRQEHDSMLSSAAGRVGGPSMRKDFINNEKAIRVRYRTTRAGRELVFSVPKSGVTPEQVSQIKQAVGRMGHTGNAVMEIAEGTGPTTSKEFVRPSDVEGMLRNIEAHPEQNWHQALTETFEDQKAGAVHPFTGKEDVPEGMTHGIEVYNEARQRFKERPTGEELKEFIQKNKNLFQKHPELRVGWDYDEKKHPEAPWELNIAAAGTEEGAKLVGKRLDQRAAFDIKNQKEVPLGGKNEQTEFPDYPLEQRLRDLTGKSTSQNNPLVVKATGESGTVLLVDVVRALEAEAQGKPRPTDQIAHAISQALPELKYQIATDNSGLGWYTSDINHAINQFKKLYPSLKDAHEQKLLKLFWTMLSYGHTPPDNLSRADRAHQLYKQTGKMPLENPGVGAWGPYAEAYRGNMRTVQRLLDKFGERGTIDWLLEKHPISELREFNPNVRGKASELEYGARVLGEKGGNFFLNLNGISDVVTVDKWITRMWRRWQGTLTEENYDAAPTQKEIKDAREAITIAAKELGLTPREAQATLWHYEQELYKKYGVGVSPESYGKGAEEYVRREIQSRGIENNSPEPKTAGKASTAARRDKSSQKGGANTSTTPKVSKPKVSGSATIREHLKSKKLLGVALAGLTGAELAQAQNKKEPQGKATMTITTEDGTPLEEAAKPKAAPKPGSIDFLNKENDYDRNTYTPEMFPVKPRPRLART